MLYLLDTNIVSDMVRHPQGPIATHVKRVGSSATATSIIVAAELHFGAKRRGSAALTKQLELIFGSLQILPFEAPADECYGELRSNLERTGQLIGPNDLLIAAHALALGATLVTDNEREFSRVRGLKVENWLR